ncbi:sulfurtransferase TusA family protein [Vibrio sp. Isolate25]|uniref:sulfurtransferase TusA family protein n=1 Tax=Vibrio TaxID=662 RepID=UPI001EFC45D8|nr:MULTISPECIES: sulfurtransferase TusA family protein [Vibrio]MCG9597191.1 sulfurtransferase TusA family protein [Vibrio sp. Isolate25]MCG9677878.1 sulfurtransferase TusA family protein [Vibrio sp. Isolate24]MCG9684079.1 sulfurtransferase TusA family protein [Vibrio sp. Isolate23]USD31763.1 sulfurtransferase TusA family protein [Vibrio sp. SCSIO 43186]USD44809.1 sulfurtransferase TusA family protein [Vibrio sp. SCSIO 43145]
MELNLLDLRQERCPMALLLAKRHTKALSEGQQTSIYVSDSSSLSDITSFLLKQSFELVCEELDGYYSLQVTKGTLSNV